MQILPTTDDEDTSEVGDSKQPTAAIMSSSSSSSAPVQKKLSLPIEEFRSSFAATWHKVESMRLIRGARIRRSHFSMLPSPPSEQTDLVWGSWWFVWGSVLQGLIPIVPLVSLFVGFWETASSYLPMGAHIVVYVLQVVVGAFFTVGSYAFLRAVHPSLQSEPFFNPTKGPISGLRKLVMTDELWGMQCLLLGILCGIPIFSLFVAYSSGAQSDFWMLVLATNVVFVLVACFGVKIAMPRPNNSEEESHDLLASYLLRCLGHIKWLAPHIANDMLVLSWGMYIGCILALIASIGLLVVAVHHGGSSREIYDYSLNGIDMVLFLIGSLYFTAGWYVIHPEDPTTPLSSPKDNSSSSSPRVRERETELSSSSSSAAQPV